MPIHFLHNTEFTIENWWKVGCLLPFSCISRITSSFLNFLPVNFGSRVPKILLKWNNFLIYYQGHRYLYRTLSSRESGVSNCHQPNHGWFWFALPYSSSTTTSPSLPWFMPNHRQQPNFKPLPSSEGCGLNLNSSALSEARMQPLPLPFPKGSGPVCSYLIGGFGEDICEGGPSKW